MGLLGSERQAHTTNQRVYLADRVNERLVELAFDWDGTVGYAENRFRMVRSIDLVAWTKARLPEASWTLRPDDLWFDGNRLHFADARNALVGLFDERWRPTLLADATTGLSAPTQVRRIPTGSTSFWMPTGVRCSAWTKKLCLQPIPTGRQRAWRLCASSRWHPVCDRSGRRRTCSNSSRGRSVLAQTGSDHGELWQPAGLAIAPDGRLLAWMWKITGASLRRPRQWCLDLEPAGR